MSHPPLRRFLGFEEDVSDRALLGFLPDDDVDNARIAAALDASLTRLERHPGAWCAGSCAEIESTLMPKGAPSRVHLLVDAEGMLDPWFCTTS